MGTKNETTYCEIRKKLIESVGWVRFFCEAKKRNPTTNTEFLVVSGKEVSVYQ